MRKWVMVAGIFAVMSASPVFAGIDLSDFDDDTMRGMDDANKDLGPALGAGNAEAALADAQVMQDGLKVAEEYFVKKGGADDAVKIAQQGEEWVAAVLAALGKKDFDAATTAARETAKNCRSCHDLYKPLK
ncbi:MAG: hypothetical protein JWR16_1978 [Nevskia sp.]|nr:hypothetical protein [Nevskia sp.]